MALGELTHVQPDHPAVRPEQRLGQRSGQLGLADAGRPEEQEAADRPAGVAKAGPRSPDRLGDRFHGLVLADDALVQIALQAEEPVPLFLGQLLDRHARGPGDHLGDVVNRDLRHDARVLAELGDLPAQAVDLVPERRRALVLLAGDSLVLVPGEFLAAPLQIAKVNAGSLNPQPHPGASLVNQVDGLVRQEPVGDVPV